jgi:hypothetical protein
MYVLELEQLTVLWVLCAGILQLYFSLCPTVYICNLFNKSFYHCYTKGSVPDK